MRDDTKEHDPIFWDCRDSEELEHDNIDDAVEDYIESWCEPDITLAQLMEHVPEEIEVTGYERDEVDAANKAEWILIQLLENLDEDYGDPNAYTDATTKMKEAALAFVKAILEEYHVWPCHQTCTAKVNTLEWLKENRPDFFEEPEKETK
jgi:hypothetical protein